MVSDPLQKAWSLYVHWPWCVRKCPYCDFNSHALRQVNPHSTPLDAGLQQHYVQALLADLDQELALFPWLQERPLQSIFFGGGTPSLMSDTACQSLMQGIARRVSLSPDCEVTLEANPGTVERQYLDAYRAAGINRLSIGIQSFSSQQLQQLGRIHTAQEAIDVVGVARQAGFTNINLDLMHGLPQQDVATAMADLEQALALQPTHLSWYQLTLEPHTPFFRQPPALPDEDALVAIQDAGEVLLAQAGWVHYEVSAYARPGHEARHNLNYWQFGDYLGLGAGAHGKISWRDAQGALQIQRRWKQRHPDAYLRGLQQDDFLAGTELLPDAERPVEFLMNALRLAAGVPPARFVETTGLPLDVLQARWQQLQAIGLVQPLQQRLACTPLGWRFLNDVLERFINKVIHSQG